MRSIRRKSLGILLASVVVSGLVSGCAPVAVSSPSRDESRAIIAAAVESVPTVTGSLVSIYSTGSSGRGVGLQLYVDDLGSLAATVDQALEAAWHAAPFWPVEISISAVDGPKPADAEMDSPDSVDIVAAAQELGLDATQVSLNVLFIDSTTLTSRYGAWIAPDSD